MKRGAAGWVVVALLLAGCTAEDDGAPAERVSTAATPETANDLARNSAHRTLKIPGERIALTVDYFLTDYDATKWQTLSTKDVHVSVHLRPTAGGTPPQVAIGSFRAEVALRAVDPGLDGLPVTVATDTPPAAVPGYAVSADYPYDTVVPVEGFSQPLVQRWTYLAGEQPLTEDGLTRAGVYANRIRFTYGLLVRNPGDTGWHRRSLTDSLTIPVART